MSIDLAEKIWSAASVYLAFGVLFSLFFAVFGAARLDRAARNAPPLFRMVIAPGAAALWPLLLLMWIAGGGANRRDAT